MTSRASKAPAKSGEKSPPTLIALVRLLARQAAREALAETNFPCGQRMACHWLPVVARMAHDLCPHVRREDGRGTA